MARTAACIALALAALALPGRAAAACSPPPAPAGKATQLVTVSARGTAASLELWQRTRGCWRRVAGPWRARVGRSGVAARHREGDGTTPAGSFAIGPTMYGVAADPGVRFRYHRLVCGDWWDEDPGSPGYNRFRHVACGKHPPFGGGSEALWTYTTAYRHFALIRYNDAPPVPGRGSAIFLHADTGGATNGCVSLPLPRLVRVLRWLRPAAHPRIAIGVRR